MTVADLIRKLEMIDDRGAIVRLAFQPGYPLASNVLDVRETTKEVETVRNDDDEWEVAFVRDDGRDVMGTFPTLAEADRYAESIEPDSETIVYIVEGHQVGYAPRNLWR